MILYHANYAAMNYLLIFHFFDITYICTYFFGKKSIQIHISIHIFFAELLA